MEDRKSGEQDKPDIEIRSAASFQYLHAHKCGKVNVRFYSNHKERKLHESYRVNLPEELQDGETYTKGEIRVRTEISIQEDLDESSYT